MSYGASDGAQERPTGGRLAAEVVRALRGWVVAVAGGVLLLGCYLGVSKETEVGRQIPYLVSGGFGGLALVIAGSALVVADKLENTRGGQGRLARQVDDLHGLIIAAAAPAVAGADDITDVAARRHAGGRREPVMSGGPSGHSGGDGSSEMLLAVPSGQTYHRSGCELIAGKTVEHLTAGDVARRGLTPCPVCDPPAAG